MPDDHGSDTSSEKQQSGNPRAPADTVVQRGFPLLAHDPTIPAPPGYQILEEVGRGGMGVVYRARDLALGRDVAVKLLQDRYPTDGPAARQFLEEAQIAGQLVHPGVPPIHQVGTLPDGRPFLVMKLIKGHTLDVLLTERADRAQLLTIFETLCDTVGYAHERGVIHRDLKPSNVMVGAFGEVQVMDWGLAKVLRGSSATGAKVDSAEPSGAPSAPTPAHSELRVPHSDDTVAGSVMGTPGYMSPEQAGGEHAKIDRRADVFALGGILCTILTGRAPYTGESVSEVHLKAVRGETADARAALAACGAEPELIALCARCLSTDPAGRPPDAGAVAKAIADLRRTTEEGARRAELDRVRTEAEQGAIRRLQSQVVPVVAKAQSAARVNRRTVLFGVPVAIGALAVGSCFAFRKRDNGSPTGGQTPPPAPGPAPEPVSVPLRNVGHKVAAVAVSADARRLAVGLLKEEPPEGGVKLFDRTAGNAAEVWWKWRDTECRGVAFSPDGKLLAVAAGGSGRLRVWSFADEKELEFANASFAGTARSVAFSPDGKYLALAIDQWDTEERTPRPGIVRVWEIGTGAKPRDLARLNYPARCVAFANDGTTLAVGMSGRVGDWVPSVELWNAATGGHLKSINAPLSIIGPAVAFAHGAPLCAAADREGVKLYRLPSLAPYEHELATGTEPTALAIRGDGAVTAIALAGAIHLHTVSTGIDYAALEKHADVVSALAFTPDGTTLISGSYDSTVREWTVPAPK